MNKEEIERLAREYAEWIEANTFNMTGQEYFIHKWDFTHFLKFLLRDHCIVPKSEVINQHSFYMLRMKEVSSARQTNRAKAIALENCFGSDLFKERSEK